MKRYHCLECGKIFEAKDKLECPICKNNKEELILKTIEIEEVINNTNIPSYKNMDIELRNKLEHFVKRRNHSSAYLKICAHKLIEIGYFDLALILERIAVSKLEVESRLINALGVNDDMRFNLNNLITKALEDVKLAKEIEELAKIKKDDDIYRLLNEIVIEEAQNLITLNTLLEKLLDNYKLKSR